MTEVTQLFLIHILKKKKKKKKLFLILGSWKLTLAMDKEQSAIEHKATANVRNWYWLIIFQVATHGGLNGGIKNIEKAKSWRRLRD